MRYAFLFSMIAGAGMALSPAATTAEPTVIGDMILLASSHEDTADALKDARKEKKKKEKEEKKAAKERAKKAREGGDEEPAAASTPPPPTATFQLKSPAGAGDGAQQMAPTEIVPPLERSKAGSEGKGLAMPVTNFQKSGDKPTPTSGPGSGVHGTGPAGAATEAVKKTPRGPELPAGTVQLLIDGKFGTVDVFPNKPVTASWNIAPFDNATGMAVFASTNPNDKCEDHLGSSGSLPPGNYGGGHPLGDANVDIGGIAVGSDVHFIGCLARKEDSGRIKYMSKSSNRIAGKYAGAPDLIVSSIEIVSKEVRFKVKNIGAFEKKPEEIRYVIGVTQTSPSGKRFTRGFSGVAALTSLARLAPGQETGEDRVTGQNFVLTGDTDIQICINQRHNVLESDFSNNCNSRGSSEVLPDLHAVAGHIKLNPPYKDPCPCFPNIFNCLGGCFDVTGQYSSDQVIITVENSGSVALARYEVGAEVRENGQRIFSGRKVVEKPLAPGETTDVSIDWKGRDKDDGSRFKHPENFSGIALVDPDGDILETNEGNNQVTIRAVTGRSVRDHRE